MPLEKLEDGKLLRFSLNNPQCKETSFDIYLHGATVTAWKFQGVDRLFLSNKAVLDGSKAIRGGIPLVFPQFGTGPASPAIQHGFARISTWTFIGLDKDTADELIARFGLEDKQVPANKFPEFPYKFRLIYEVRLGKDGTLGTQFSLKNMEAAKDFAFTALLHTYFKVPDVRSVKVSGLKGKTFVDKVAGGRTSQETRDYVIIDNQETDRVYQNAISTKDLNIFASETILFSIRATGEFKDVVVWNPWAEKAAAMSDFDNDRFTEMICIELGAVGKMVVIKAGEEWQAGQVITAK